LIKFAKPPSLYSGELLLANQPNEGELLKEGGVRIFQRSCALAGNGLLFMFDVLCFMCYVLCARGASIYTTKSGKPLIGFTA